MLDYFMIKFLRLAQNQTKGLSTLLSTLEHSCDGTSAAKSVEYVISYNFLVELLVLFIFHILFASLLT